MFKKHKFLSNKTYNRINSLIDYAYKNRDKINRVLKMEPAPKNKMVELYALGRITIVRIKFDNFSFTQKYNNDDEKIDAFVMYPLVVGSLVDSSFNYSEGPWWSYLESQLDTLEKTLHDAVNDYDEEQNKHLEDSRDRFDDCVKHYEAKNK